MRDHRKRVREKREAGGTASWHDYEVLELLLMHAIPRRDTKPAAKELLLRFGSLPDVLHAAPEDLTAVPGVGPQSAELFGLVREIVTRYFKYEATGKDLLASPAAIAAYAQAELAGEPNEVILGIYLDTKNRLLAATRLATGTIDRTPLFPRRVAEEALARRAKGVVLVHNHPSGDTAPSADDHALTESVARALKTVGVLLHDHLVVARTGHFSFRTAGLLPPG